MKKKIIIVLLSLFLIVSFSFAKGKYTHRKDFNKIGDKLGHKMGGHHHGGHHKHGGCFISTIM